MGACDGESTGLQRRRVHAGPPFLCSRHALQDRQIPPRPSGTGKHYGKHLTGVQLSSVGQREFGVKETEHRDEARDLVRVPRHCRPEPAA